MEDTHRVDAPWRRERRAARYRSGRHNGWPGAAVAAGFIQVIGSRDAAFHIHPDNRAYLLLLIGPLALLQRHRAPLLVFAVAAAASLWFTAFAVPRAAIAAAPAIALFTLAKDGRRRAAVIAAGVAFAGYLVMSWAFPPIPASSWSFRIDVRSALLLAAGLSFVIFLGGAAKIRGEHLAEMIKVRAERERAKEEQEKRQASEERLRIAQELHDVLGHHLSLINVQAGVGLHLMDNRPEQAREALSAIKTASSEALREVRAVLGVLRTEDEAAPRQPVLGLSRLSDLTADAGFAVTTEITGVPRDLPAEVDRAAYRIVQEALTNVRKHAGTGATAAVTVEYLPAALRLAVRNEGPVVSADGDGSGIAGMRARAQSLGGTLEAGPVPEGFLVSVLLPLSTEENT